MYTIENKAAFKSDYSPISYLKRFPVWSLKYVNCIFFFPSNGTTPKKDPEKTKILLYKITDKNVTI